MRFQYRMLCALSFLLGCVDVNVTPETSSTEGSSGEDPTSSSSTSSATSSTSASSSSSTSGGGGATSSSTSGSGGDAGSGGETSSSGSGGSGGGDPICNTCQQMLHGGCPLPVTPNNSCSGAVDSYTSLAQCGMTHCQQQCSTGLQGEYLFMCTTVANNFCDACLSNHCAAQLSACQ
jgi:hypothetical protein